MASKLQLLRLKVYTTEAATVAQSIGLLPLSETCQNDDKLMPALTRLSTKTGLIFEAINRTRTKSKLKEHDAQRDKDYRSLYYSVKGGTYNSDSTISVAAKAIYNIYDQFGLVVIGENYSQESAHIEALLLHLKTAEALAAIDQLPGISQAIANLTQSQAAFSEAYVNSESTKAQLGACATATELKREILDIINHQLVPYLQAMNGMGIDGYGEFSAQLSQIVNDTNTSIKKRLNKSKI